MSAKLYSGWLSLTIQYLWLSDRITLHGEGRVLGVITGRELYFSKF